MSVCSKRGPTIAFSLGFWLLLHTVARFGACSTRFSSPSSTDSTIVVSMAPLEDRGVAFVEEMGELAGLGLGLFAGEGSV